MTFTPSPFELGVISVGMNLVGLGALIVQCSGSTVVGLLLTFSMCRGLTTTDTEAYSLGLLAPSVLVGVSSVVVQCITTGHSSRCTCYCYTHVPIGPTLAKAMQHMAAFASVTAGPNLICIRILRGLA